MDTKELKIEKEEYAAKITEQVSTIIGDFQLKTGIKVTGIFLNLSFDPKSKKIIESTNICLGI